MSTLALLLGVRPQAGSFEPSPAASRALRVDGAQTERVNRPAGLRGARDTATFSPEALEAAARLEADEASDVRQAEEPQDGVEGEQLGVEDPESSADAPSDAEGEETENAAAPRGTDGEPLSDAEVEQVRELQARDQEVRQHEQAHVAAGGPYVTSGPTYQYQQGPDGRRYAVGGNVGIDVSPEDTPEETIAKAQVVRQAALAPAEPSAQDLRVASQASQLEQQARAELSEQQREETESGGESGESDSEAKSIDFFG